MSIRPKDDEDSQDFAFRLRESHADFTLNLEELEEDATDGKLTYRQELFCKCFTGLYTDTAGNATRSYKKAYNCNYETANANGYRLMVNDGVLARIAELNAKVMTNDEADFELAYVIRQRSDLWPKVSAYMAHAKVGGRIIDRTQAEMTPEVKDFYERLIKSNHTKAKESK